MKKSFRILIHLGFWAGYFFLMAIILFAALQDDNIPPEDYAYYFFFITGIGVIPPVISFYAHYNYLFTNYLQQQKIWATILVSILISSFCTLVGLSYVNLMHADAAQCIEEGFPYAVGFTFGLSTLIGVIALVLKGFLTWYEELKIKEELVEKNHRMELALVKSQLDPHFLFNTINNIDVLITKDPEKASQYLNKLSDIMRFMLYETKTEEIPLSQELEYIEKYIELQRIRTANENYVHYDVKGCPKQKKVAPMVFIPFIENAFKHSGNKKLDHAVNIDIQIQDDAIQFKCANKFEPNHRARNGANGLGNDLIQRRLNLLYPRKHHLAIDHQANQYRVDLTIQHGAV